MKPILLLIDLQNDYLARAALRPRPSQIVRRAAALLAGCRRIGVPVIHGRTTLTRGDDRRMAHWKKENRWMCVDGTVGHEAPPMLRLQMGEWVVNKRGFSVFEDASLDVILKRLGCDTLLIAGVCLHACVRAAALDAHGRGYRVIVAADAVASDDPLHAAITRRYFEDRTITFRPVSHLLQALSQRLTDIDAGAVFVHRSPRDVGKTLFTFEETPPEAIGTSTAATRQAFLEWRTTPVSHRQTLLADLARAIEQQSQELAPMLADHVGKPVKHGAQEINLGVVFLRYAAERADVFPCRTGHRYMPLGTIAVITPWNNPIAVALGKLAPALLYGNAVVWKPAPAGARIADRIRQVLSSVGCPADLVRIVHGTAVTARRLVCDRSIDAATITGSIEAGYAIEEICARRHIPIQGEFGGNNASIVWADADLNNAAVAIACGAFGSGGQRCTANRRVVLDDRCYDAFVGELIVATAELAWGDPQDPATEVGPVISIEKREDLAAIINDARQAGCRVIIPHETLGPRAGCPEHGAYLPPTIILCDDPTDPIVQDESFGPILVIQRAREFAEAIDLANGVEHGLVAAFFGRSCEYREIFLRDSQAGLLKINQSTVGADAHRPFGGWKASGIGPPEHGASDREFYTRTQAVYLDDDAR
jgi:acyl-CoA reductase-like NAD-dependent aldehyde dehydrogenase/nicotinamidase-related amidase